jgi:hypothetical protein
LASGTVVFENRREFMPPTIPLSSIIPGAQLTVPRSVAPVTPTQVIWANSGYVDFVADCGADPTGVADIGGAGGPLDVAYGILQELNASNTCVTSCLYFPPGLYTMKTNPTNQSWSLNGIDSHLILQGLGDASVIAFDGVGATIHFPNLVVATVTVRDLSFYGSSTPTSPPYTPDCDYALYLDVAAFGTIERCSFQNLMCYDEAIYLTGNAILMLNVSVIDSAVSYSTGALTVIQDVYWFSAIQCRWHDVQSGLDNLPYGAKSFQNAGGYVLYKATNTICRFFSMRECHIDEAAQYELNLLGTSAFPIFRVQLNDVNFSPPCLSSPTQPIVTITYANWVEVDGYYMGDEHSGGYHQNVIADILHCESCDDVRVRNVFIVPEAQSTAIFADSGCGSLLLEGCQGITTNSSAQQTVTQQQGWSMPNAYAVTLPGATV